MLTCPITGLESLYVPIPRISHISLRERESMMVMKRLAAAPNTNGVTGRKQAQVEIMPWLVLG